MPRTEQEQIEIFTHWWKGQGLKTLAVVGVALAAYVGWTQWQAHQHRNAEAASALYQELLESAQPSGATDQKDTLLKQLREEYPDTFYGQAALLFLAQAAVEKGELEAAATHLDTLIKQNPSDDLAYTARYRSAKVLHSLGREDEALARLQKPVAGFKVMFAELQGDIYVAKQQLDKARSAYEEALAAVEAEKSNQKDVLEMKLSQASAAP